MSTAEEVAQKCCRFTIWRWHIMQSERIIAHPSRTLVSIVVVMLGCKMRPIIKMEPFSALIKNNMGIGPDSERARGDR